MAIDMFLDIQNKKIKGECIDKAYPDTIQVLTWSWETSRGLDTGRMNPDYGRAKGAPIFKVLSFTKFVDRSSPMLLTAFATATEFTEAKLMMRRAGGKPFDYMTYTLEKVMIASIASGVTGMEPRQIETVNLSFLRLTASYQGQGADGGKAGGLVEATISVQGA
ncbi:MAG: type VI secretion system tube protein Hcp [Planctomycetota bacterium]